MSGETASTAVTATVFCAVIALIAVVPCTPARANALRSAWIPAPPPESDPAIDRHTGMRCGSAVTAGKDRTAAAVTTAAPRRSGLRGRDAAGRAARAP